MMMRIVVLNIRAGGGQRIDNLLGYLDEQDPHTVLLTEWRQGPAGTRIAALLPRSPAASRRATFSLSWPDEAADCGVQIRPELVALGHVPPTGGGSCRLTAVARPR